MSNENIIRILKEVLAEEIKDNRSNIICIIFGLSLCFYCSFLAKNATGFYSLLDAFVSGFIFSEVLITCHEYKYKLKKISRIRKDLDEYRRSSL